MLFEKQKLILNCIHCKSTCVYIYYDYADNVWLIDLPENIFYVFVYYTGT